MYSILKKLINKRYYKTKAEAVERVDVAYSMQKISEAQYTELLALIDEVYGADAQ